MAAFSTFALFVALRLLALIILPSTPVGAAPTPQASSAAGSASTYWVANIQRQGTAAFNSDPSNYTVFRNVMDYGATGDGTTDDTAAINAAISAGDRCGQGCDSSTTTPAMVYFPPGTYLVSTPIIQLYYTQLVGDAVTPPTLKAAASFTGMAVIDADPYDSSGNNWYTNQNNFYRQIRNFVIDLTGMPSTSGAGIHWQVAQATSLQNIVFNMVQGGSGNKQQGIFMDNGSGGFMTDLTFNGGNYGAFFGNQQFTTRNLTFNNCNTAIYMNWNWAWTLKSISINNCGIGIDMANGVVSGAGNQTVGSVLVIDSTISTTEAGISTAFGTSSQPTTGGTLIVDNVDFTGSSNAITNPDGTVILAGGSVVTSWAQGNEFTSNSATSSTGTASGTRAQGALTGPSKPAALLTGTGTIYERSKPQYEDVPAASFVSVKSNGAKGDGSTDDTAAIQALMNSVTTDQILYFDSGAYVISSTITVPKNIRITGEIWPLIMAKGSAFSDVNNPAPVFQVGSPGDEGAVEISELIFQTIGPQPGAIMVQWNVHDPSGQQGASGMWDVHARIGGSAGTDLESNTCAKDPSDITSANTACEGAFLLLQVTSQASIYLENNWFWVADHELDLSDHGQINIFNGRGVLIESADGPVWMYGTSVEHNVLYNYQVANASAVFMGLIQTETPYFQSNPDALSPYTPNTAYSDPDFSDCPSGGSDNTCVKSWGLRILDSTDVLVYGAGLYSFFDNYEQTCLTTNNCQENIVSIEGCSSSVWLFGLTTIGTTNMVTYDDGGDVVPQSGNTDVYGATIALFQQD